MPLTRQINVVSVSTTGQSGDLAVEPKILAINRDGSLVGFATQSGNQLFSPNPAGSDYVIKNMVTGAISSVSFPVSGNLQIGGGAGSDYNELSLSASGLVQAFGSTALLTSPSDSTGKDIFVNTGSQLTLISNAQGGVKSFSSFAPDISDNGNYVVFLSMDNLLGTTDANGSGDADAYLFDATTGALSLITGAANGSVQGSNNGFEADTFNVVTSNDGRFVVFDTRASNIVTGDTNGHQDVFLKDMATQQAFLLSRAASGQQGNFISGDPAMTPDANFVVFTTQASNILPNDANGGVQDVLRVNLFTEQIELVSSSASGVAGGAAYHPQISADGRYVVFESYSTTLVPTAGDTGNVLKIFVKDMKTGAIDIVSRSESGALNTLDALAPQISDDGQFIAFTTASSLVSADINGLGDVYRVTNPVYGQGSNLENDVFADSPGNETISGGAGLDTVVYGGNREDFSAIAKSANGYTVAGDGLSSIERVKFWDKQVALDLTSDGNAGQAMQFIGTIAPALLNEQAVRGLIISLFDQEFSMLQLCQLALDLNLVPHASSGQLANAIFRNVTGATTDAPTEIANALTNYINANGEAVFVAAVAGLSINVDLVGYSQTGLEFM